MTAHCSQIVRSTKIINIGKECYGIVIYFKSKEEEDESFYFVMDLDNDGS